MIVGIKTFLVTSNGELLIVQLLKNRLKKIVSSQAVCTYNVLVKVPLDFNQTISKHHTEVGARLLIRRCHHLIPDPD